MGRACWDTIARARCTPALLLLLCLTLAATMAAACSDTTQPCPEGTERWVKYELFMGRGGPSGELVVQDAAWDAFLAEEVTSRFPDGLTVLDAYGQWRNPEGVIEMEPSKLLVILAPPGDGPADLISEVANEYKARFTQETVLKTTSDSCIEFR